MDIDTSTPMYTASNDWMRAKSTERNESPVSEIALLKHLANKHGYHVHSGKPETHGWPEDVQAGRELAKELLERVDNKRSTK